MKLDLSRPYGIIMGDHPARYEQDGQFFDVHGELYGAAPTTTVASGAARKKAAPAPAAPVMADQLDAQLAGE